MANKLQEYKKKRRVKESGEPVGASASKLQQQNQKTQEPFFVIQKHAARHLHYDLRLETKGVMASWAVPKGPSLNPSDKRLAMQVEDHPLDYRTFEGTIPLGNYGAGNVMVWDEGTYTVPNAKTRAQIESYVKQGIEKGHFEFIVHGKKLQGAFALAKIAAREGNKDNSWLLIKKRDEYASHRDITQEGLSAASGRTMEEIEAGIKPSVTSLDEILNKAPKIAMPTHLRPMLASLVKQPFDDAEWLFEVKWDGYRALAYLEEGKVELVSRANRSFSKLFAPLCLPLQKLPVKNAILDGEVVVVDENGKPDFQQMQNYQSSKKGNLLYYLFDLIYLDGRDLRALPLITRKEILKTLLQRSPDFSSQTLLRYSDHIIEEGIAFFHEVDKQQLEGIVGKRLQSPYRMVRSRDWVKIKTHQQQEAIIGGFTQPRGSRKRLGALLLGVYQDKELVYIGHVGGGFNDKLLEEIYRQLATLAQAKSPFKIPPKPNTPVTWVKPVLVCEVTFTEWTSDGRLRHPIFKGMRIDKEPKNVKRELL